MTRITALTLAAVLLACVPLAAAGEHMTPADAKATIKMLDDAKMTLAKSIETAETCCKGKAGFAGGHKHEGKVDVMVVSMVGEKWVECHIDAAGKCSKTSDWKPAADDKDHKPADMAKAVAAMGEAKITWAKAIEAAEGHSKGRAFGAHVEMEKDALDVEVYCLVGEKMMKCEMDKTGKVTKMEEMKGDAHAGHDHGDKKEDKKEKKDGGH
ncbi:hypothetical protein RAS1_02990 [Phycisphaerae bacterium RAS1]|nr:hypothetical protein RAS1_02990 [Phycisphaerae bacterium RAS1]